MVSRLRDNDTAIGMADEDYAAFLSVEYALRKGDIIRQRFRRVLHDADWIPILFQRVIHALPS